MENEFRVFPKIKRLSRDMVVTEKLDGTNASVWVNEDDTFAVGSKNRFITPDDDNFGFARWAYEHEDELREGLGYGTHYGEWWGQGIQRKYGLEEKRFSLFNRGRWNPDNVPECVSVVPLLYEGPFSTVTVDALLEELYVYGSMAAPGFMNPEGVVVFHTHANVMFKKTLDHNDKHKFMYEEDNR